MENMLMYKLADVVYNMINTLKQTLEETKQEYNNEIKELFKYFNKP